MRPVYPIALSLISMLPQLNDLILAGARDTFPIEAPIQGIYLVLVAGQILLQFAHAHIPHLDSGVLATRRQQSRITRPRHHVHRPDVAAHRGHELPVPRIPQLDAVVEARGCDARAVGRKRDV